MRTLLLAAFAAFALSSAQAFSYATGFETADGFSLGAINGQNGYTTFTAAQDAPVISDANPFTGNQHLRLPDDPNVADGTLNGAFSQDFSSMTTGDTFFDLGLDMSITSAGGADYDIVGQTPGQTNLSFRMKFGFEGNILILDDVGNGAEFVDTGVSWTNGAYKHVEIQVDTTTDRVDYFYDGANIYNGMNFSSGFGTNQFVIFSDSFQNPDEFGDVDNVTLDTQSVPEPATMVLLGLGLAGFAARRKKA